MKVKRGNMKVKRGKVKVGKGRRGCSSYPPTHLQQIKIKIKPTLQKREENKRLEKYNKAHLLKAAGVFLINHTYPLALSEEAHQMERCQDQSVNGSQ